MMRALLCLLILASSPVVAQQSSFVGTWNLSYPGGAMRENGVMTPIMATGVLTITATGDSLIGTLVMNPHAELGSRPDVRMMAGVGSTEATFVSRSEATLSTNGEERKAAVISTWKLAVAGDSLSGTVERTLEGFEEANQPPTPVTGSRAKR